MIIDHARLDYLAQTLATNRRPLAEDERKDLVAGLHAALSEMSRLGNRCDLCGRPGANGLTREGKMHQGGCAMYDEEGNQLKEPNHDHPVLFKQNWSAFGIQWGYRSPDVGQRIVACLTACRNIPQPILKAMIDSDKVRILIEIVP